MIKNFDGSRNLKSKELNDRIVLKEGRSCKTRALMIDMKKLNMDDAMVIKLEAKLTDALLICVIFQALQREQTLSRHLVEQA